VSEKLEQIAKAMAQYEEQEQENLIKNNGETKPRAVCAAVVASAGRGGMGMGWGQWGKNGWERDLHDVNHMFVCLLVDEDLGFHIVGLFRECVFNGIERCEKALRAVRLQDGLHTCNLC
jgi:hypothetical protein